MADAAKVLCGITLANAALVLGEAHIERVVHSILDPPVATDCRPRPLGVGAVEATDAITPLATGALWRHLACRFHDGNRTQTRAAGRNSRSPMEKSP